MDLPPSKRYDSLMVVVDYDLSKGIILIPCTKNIDALETIDAHHVLRVPTSRNSIVNTQTNAILACSPGNQEYLDI